jgi:hypothetical protein
VQAQLDATRSLLQDTQAAHERDKHDLDVYRQDMRQAELNAMSRTGPEQALSTSDKVEGSLDDELEGLTSPTETRTE